MAVEAKGLDKALSGITGAGEARESVQPSLFVPYRIPIKAEDFQSKLWTALPEVKVEEELLFHKPSLTNCVNHKPVSLGDQVLGASTKDTTKKSFESEASNPAEEGATKKTNIVQVLKVIP